MKVLFFAQAREAAGCGEVVLKSDRALTQPEFWALLIAAFPPLASHHNTARLARLETYLTSDDLIDPNDEIAVIPPVSGG